MSQTLHSQTSSDNSLSELRGYRLGERLGSGATGIVYAAERRFDGMPVAIKTLRPRVGQQPHLVRRLLREAEVGRNVDHSGVLPTLDVGRTGDGAPYVVMPRLTGTSLASLLRRFEVLDVQTTAALAVRVADILHAVHVAGYTHRDVKPEHIVVGEAEAGQASVHLIDFGVCASSRASEEERNAERGRVFGTPSYVSPEQAAGDPLVDGRADLYSLGLVIFEALTGEMAFDDGNVTQVLLRIIQQDVPELAALVPVMDPEFEWVFRSLVEREREQRLPSARAAARALQAFAGPGEQLNTSLLALLDADKRVVAMPAAAIAGSSIAA